MGRSSIDHAFRPDFRYRHDNPYHDRLQKFSHFVMRDTEAEEFTGRWNKDVFKREAPLCLEIGSGYGQFMRQYCEEHPHENFVGLDYRFKRSYELARKLANKGLDNCRYLRAKGERLGFLFGEGELDKIFYFYPDPWPKRRHHKKRLFQRPFLESAYKVLKPGGILYVKTDHDGYAYWMWERLKDQELFDIELKTTDLMERYPDHFLTQYRTKFEKIFLNKGERIKAFVLKSKKESA